MPVFYLRRARRSGNMTKPFQLVISRYLTVRRTKAVSLRPSFPCRP